MGNWYLLEHSTEQQEKIAATFEEFGKALEQLAFSFQKVLTPVLQELSLIWENYHRDTFRRRLIGIGLSYRLAEWVSKKWPTRYLPLDWILKDE